MKNIGVVIDKIGKERFFRRINFILFIVLIGMLAFYFNRISYQDEEEIERIHNFTSLEDIVKYEIKTAIENNITGNCLTFATYYNKTFSEKYPELDVRWLRKVDICNKCTLCENLHTYIVVNGYLSSCIIDQTQFACTNLR